MFSLPSPKQTWRAVRAASDNNLGLVAAGVAFYAFLAFVPLLAALVLAYGLVADPATVSRHAQSLGTVLPSAAAELITDQLEAVTGADQGRTRLGLLLSLLAALWGASKGAKSIIIALNIVHHVEETRGFLGQTLTALLITGATILSIVAALAAITVFGFVESLLPMMPLALHTAVQLLFWVAAGLLGAAAMALIYRHAPHWEGASWRRLFPGALFATILWLAATFAFGLYVASFGNYNATYGALGAVVVMLMWLYLSAYVLLLGAEVNEVRGASRVG
ncbi:hypothetical protein B5C34_02910 [Pacificimonas flava]|uniref:Uncharacterized protein n=2 Tax=Pacificimonas TaxID=1960290 RepID=A0A219B8A1_9SPHN|nr:MULTISPECIES: YihY/virulence factor BrkB family protein [Pacificimonas]MBZ6377829.1 YihY/virulence factor BrkB family protein [Pacificimonas aurantium]OWV34605.1 hypothetical protein B5C34_02910 [Pacificimonas flava]